MFASIALVIGLTGFGFFVKLMGLPTQRWYYIPAMGFAVVCCDVILPRIHQAARIGVLVIAVVVAMERLAVARRNERQHAAAEVVFAGELAAEVRGDAPDVFHQGDRILEDVVVDALQNVTNLYSTLVEYSTTRIVDVAAAVRLGVEEFAVDVELARQGAKVV